VSKERKGEEGRRGGERGSRRWLPFGYVSKMVQYLDLYALHQINPSSNIISIIYLTNKDTVA